MPNTELLERLNTLKSDPSLREFRPVLEEMIVGIQNPYNSNTQKVLELLESNILSYRVQQLATFLYLNQTTNP